MGSPGGAECCHRFFPRSGAGLRGVQKVSTFIRAYMPLLYTPAAVTTVEHDVARREKDRRARARAREKGKYHKLQKLDFIIKNQDDCELGLLFGPHSVSAARARSRREGCAASLSCPLKRGAQRFREMPGGYGAAASFPKTAESIPEWLRVIGMVRCSARACAHFFHHHHHLGGSVCTLTRSALTLRNVALLCPAWVGTIHRGLHRGGHRTCAAA